MNIFGKKEKSMNILIYRTITTDTNLIKPKPENNNNKKI